MNRKIEINREIEKKNMKIKQMKAAIIKLQDRNWDLREEEKHLI